MTAAGRLRRRVVPLVASLCLGAGCGGDAWDIRQLEAEGDCIVVFGDSLAAGHGIDQAQAFPALLAQQLGVPVVVEATVGDTTRDGLGRFDGAVPRHRPFLVVIELGANDFTHRVPQDETFRNIEQLVYKVHRLPAAAVIVAVDATPIGDTYGEGYSAIARRLGTGVVTGLLDDVFAHPKYMLDVVHPNAEGHPFLAARVARALKPLLARMPAARRLQAS